MIEFFRSIGSYLRPYQGRMFLGALCGVLCAFSNGLLMLTVKMVANLVFAAFEPSGTEPAATASDLGPAVLGPAWLGDWVNTWMGWFEGLQLEKSRLALLIAVLTIPAVFTLRGVLGYLNVYLMNWSAFRAIGDLRTHLFDHLQNLSLGFFSQANTGDLISRISNDTVVLQNALRTSVASLIKDPVTVVVMIAILLTQHLKLTLISLVVFPVLLVPIRVYARKARQAVRGMQQCSADLTSLMHEDITCNRIIKAYNLESSMLEQFRDTTRKYVHHAMRVVRAHEIPSQLSEFFGAVGVTLVLLFILFRPDGSMTPGDFIQFAGSIFMLYQPIKALSRVHNQFAQAAAANQRIFELLHQTNTVTDPPNPVPLRAQGAPIRFQRISFSYGEKPVLHEIDLTIQPGQVCALVGSSGSGKTTLTNLLLRFYDPQAGAVCIGDTNIRSVKLAELRHQIAVVTQEVLLFNDTIRHNIALGKPDASDTEIEAAARGAHAHDFIREKPQGYLTLVGEKGVALSGGQRQRLAIARAILRNAPILVLDEATSALDTESERLVQEALEGLMHGRTTICIAHRLSTIQNADVIVVLDQGRMVESGRHLELLRRDGHYRRLYELQFQPASAHSVGP
jgi:subfamily B ATP-binding cassette protein MsbA